LKVGDRIKSLRKENDLTLRELAKKANISHSFLSDIENNRSNPSLKRLQDIAKALDVTVSYLLGEEEQNQPILEKLKKFLSKEEQKFLINLVQKEGFHSFLRETRGASDEDLATAVRVFKAVKEGKEKGEQL